MKNLWKKFKSLFKMSLTTRDMLVFLVLLSLIMVVLAGCAAYAVPAAGAVAIVAPWYATINWTQVIVTVAGGGGLFAVVKYVLDYRLGVKKVKSEDKKEDNRQEESYVQENKQLRDEYKAMVVELRAELENLRKRISLLEVTLAENNIPLPYVKDIQIHA